MLRSTTPRHEQIFGQKGYVQLRTLNDWRDGYVPNSSSLPSISSYDITNIHLNNGVLFHVCFSVGHGLSLFEVKRQQAVVGFNKSP